MKTPNHFRKIISLRPSIKGMPILLAGLVLLLNACSGYQSYASASSGGSPKISPTATSITTGMPSEQMPTPAPVHPKAYIGLFKDDAIAVLDTVTNLVITRIPVPKGPHGLVITPDGQRVFVSSDGDSKVSVIDTKLDVVYDTIDVGKSPHGLAITPDGNLVLVADFATSQVVFIDSNKDIVVGQVAVPNPHNIAISPDGHTAYVAAQLQGSTGLSILNIDKKIVTGNVPLDKTPRALNFSPDGKLLYFTLAGVDAVQVLDPATNKITTQIPVGASPHHPLFTPNGRFALVVSQGPGELSILDPKTNKVTGVVTVGKMPHWIATNSQGTIAWVTNETSNDVSAVDLASGKVTATISVGNAPRKIVVQPVAPVSEKNPPASQAGFMTSINGMAFADPVIIIRAGESITWTNHDSIDHTVTSDDGQWDSGNISSGKSYTLTLNQPGQYSYHCSIHPFMTGTIIVNQ